jgi:hypothetical protein
MEWRNVLKVFSAWMRLGALALLMLGALRVSAQTYTAAVTGRVYDAATEAPIPGAVVQFTGAVNASAVTDEDGRFALDNLPIPAQAALVDAVVSVTGYGTWTGDDGALLANDTMILDRIALSETPQTVFLGGLPESRDISPDLLEFMASQQEEFSSALFSHAVIPPAIRVGVTGYTKCFYNIDGDPAQRVYYPFQRLDIIDFRDYVKSVLPQEWPNAWHVNSLRAGAMAVKMYAWWKINLGMRTNYGVKFDVWGDTCDQYYNPNRRYASTDAAVDATWNYLMLLNGQVSRIHYTASDAVCQNAGLSPCMSQNGSRDMAEAGSTWQQILAHYYPGFTVTTATTPFGNLLKNGDFSGGMANWATWDAITYQVSGGRFEFYRNPGGVSAVVMQMLGIAMPDNRYLELSLQLGNSSSIRKRALIILHDNDWSDQAVCSFWLPPYTPLRTYYMRTQTTEPWFQAQLSVYAATADGMGWLQLDNVVLNYRPDLSTDVTMCFDPAAPR